MQTLFEYTLRKKDDPAPIIKYNARVFIEKLPNTLFLEELVYGVLEHRDEIDAKLIKYAPEWPLEKIATIERVILEIALFELIFTSGIPHAVIINEAVEIGKSYADANSNKFINGVLATASREINQKNVKSK